VTVWVTYEGFALDAKAVAVVAWFAVSVSGAEELAGTYTR